MLGPYPNDLPEAKYFEVLQNLTNLERKKKRSEKISFSLLFPQSITEVLFLSPIGGTEGYFRVKTQTTPP
jgi:hypothetical protein